MEGNKKLLMSAILWTARTLFLGLFVGNFQACKSVFEGMDPELLAYKTVWESNWLGSFKNKFYNLPLH